MAANPPAQCRSITRGMRSPVRYYDRRCTDRT
jgi:hypothetical protein